MKHTQSLALAILLPAMLFSSVAIADSAPPSSEIDKVSYGLGVKTAENFNAHQIKINGQQFTHGLNAVLNKQKVLMSEKEIQEVLTKFQKEQIALLSKREKQQGAANLAASNAFFAKNKTQPGVITTSSGLQYIELTPGKGSSPKASDFVQVNYRGTLLNGTEFDSSYDRKEANTFQVENLIPGWQEALQLMKPGAKWKVFVPPQLGYGSKGAGQVIEPNSALIFEIELVSVKPNA
ncbi:MAG TPA: FKBP-type peptidyl-prolyl cis-trans isomerase [Gammaproteobacteria bacterium]|nr:FKBP-type peptidyl-prolyl cis-trans isomerase [Gammaproteobacteria bacterium]